MIAFRRLTVLRANKRSGLLIRCRGAGAVRASATSFRPAAGRARRFWSRSAGSFWAPGKEIIRSTSFSALLRGRHPGHPEKRHQALDVAGNSTRCRTSSTNYGRKAQGRRDLEGDVRDPEEAHPGPLRVHEKRGSTCPGRHRHGGGHVGCRRRARPAGNAGGNAAGGVQSLGFYVGRLPEFREKEPELVFEPQDFLEGLIRQPPRTETPITLPAVVNGQIIPREPDMLWYSPERFTPGDCRPLPLRGPQGPATGHRRQRRGN